MADYGSLYQGAGNQYQIDPLLLQSMAGKESGQDPNAVGPPITTGPDAGKHALGFMQFSPSTAAQYNVTDPFSPTQSVYGAANYMDTLLKKHDGNLRAALAEYSGNGGNQQAPYVNDVMGRYTGLQRAWSPGPVTQTSSAPTTDTDPNSPTAGSPTGKNFTTPPQAPTFGTTAKGNPGQPAASVPTTAASDAPAPGISMAAPGLQPPSGGGPKGERAAAPAPDYLHDAPAPGTPPKATPAAPSAPAAATSPDYLHDAPLQVDASGQPIPQADTGEYLTAPQSPGAKATMPLGGPLEGFELGPGSQAKIGTATDPMQRVRIAASEAGVTPDSIIVGADNRLAAVGTNGVPYYLTPQRIFANQEGVTKDAQGNWQPMGSFQFSPYATQSPLTPNAPGSFTPGNLVRGGAAELPALAAQVPAVAGTMAGEAVGGPLGGSLGTGAGVVVGQGGRQWLANRFDPNNATAPNPVTGETLKNALIAGGSYGLGRYMLGGQGPTTVYRPNENWLYNRPQPITRQQPYGLQDRLFPWESPQRWELPPSQDGKFLLDAPQYPSSPVPGAVPLQPGESPLEVAGVPQVKSDAQIAAEDRAIPTSGPPRLLPLITDQAYKERAKDIVRWFAQNGNTTPEPGVTGSLSQVTGNRGVAALERGLRNEGGPVANQIGQLEDAQAAANRDTIANLRGDEDQLTQLRQARRQQTAALEEKAVGSITGPADPSSVQSVIEDQLGSRAAQDPNVASALRDVHERLYQHDPLTGKQVLDESGNPQLQTDPELLMGLRQSLAREMTRSAQSGRPDMRLASLQLAPVLDELDATITRAMPAYPEFNAAYREASKPITAMEYLQGRNLLDTTTQTPMLSAVQKTLDDIYRQRVLAHGWQPAQDLSQDQIDQLTGLRDQLRRQANLRRGIAIGSPTMQNLATSQTTNVLMNPLMRAARPAIASAMGVHEFGLPGFALGMGEAALEGVAAQRSMAARQRLYGEIAKLLINENGEGVAALQGQ